MDLKSSTTYAAKHSLDENIAAVIKKVKKEYVA